MAEAWVIRKKLLCISSMLWWCIHPLLLKQKQKLFNLPPLHTSGIYSIAHFCCPHMIESIQLPPKIHIQAMKMLWTKGRGEKDKEICTYPIISFIWRRFENNSPSHLSLSGHIIHKWSLQNINSISIKGGWISTHEGWIYQIIILAGTLVASKYFPVRGNQKQTAEY